MVSATEDLLNQGIDALIISPFKPDALGPIVDAAKAKGIPVVINDIGGGGTDYDVIVISDNYNGGVMAAEYMDELVTAKGSAKKVASITCEPSAVYAARRNQGFEAKIQELGYEVVATLSGNSRQEEGYKVMGDILSANPDVAGVFSCNDPMAVGAAQAIADAGKSGAEDIFVVGFNADEIALEAIKAGQMAGTVQQVPYEMGQMTVDLATQLAAGESLDYDNPEEREIFVPVNMITPEPSGDAGAGEAMDLKIGFSVYDMQYGFFQDMEAGTRDAAEAMGITAKSLKDVGLIDQIIREPLGSAHRDVDQTARNIKQALTDTLEKFETMGMEKLLEERYRRLTSYGEFLEETAS
jgi:ribose transport system substrate-binding protein